METVEEKLGKPEKTIREKEDFYFNKAGLMVFTENYHLKRGYCCKSKCLHCPYELIKK